MADEETTDAEDRVEADEAALEASDDDAVEADSRTYVEPEQTDEEPELPSARTGHRAPARHQVDGRAGRRRSRPRDTQKRGLRARLTRRGDRRDPLEQLSGRIPVLGVIGATVLAGLLFGPAFGSATPRQVVVPVAAVAAVVYLCFELARHWRRFEEWRGVATVLLGLLAVVETTLYDTTKRGLPTTGSVQALIDGVRGSWLKTLQSTLPARPDPELVVFVPLLVLVALVVAVQILTRTTVRLASLAPGLLVAGLAQAYHPVTAVPAVLVALGFALAGAAVLGSVPRIKVRTVVVALAATTPIILIGTLAAAATDPADRNAYSLQEQVSPARKPQVASDPLANVADRLLNPTTPQFRVTGPPDTERWPITVLDRFDGVNWHSSAKLRTLGSRIDSGAKPKVSTNRHTARIEIDKLGGPFIPSQDGLESVSGIRPVVDPKTGEMLYGKVTDRTSYRIGWGSPDLDANSLKGAAVTPHLARGTRDMGQIPQNIQEIAREIAADREPDFAMALAIERYLRTNYREAVGDRLPSGFGMPQIAQFLGAGDKRAKGTAPSTGTSVLFATSFVVLAQFLGIPARVAVGFRQPASPEKDGTYLIHNSDALAWPEVSVNGVGWVALDPIGQESQRPANDGSSIGKAINNARGAIPPPMAKPTPRAASPRDPVAPKKDEDNSFDFVPWLRWVAIALLVVLAVRIVGVPLLKLGRTRLRRRRSGNAAIVSAWLEARDRLRDYGVPITSDMTVRDAGDASRVALGASTGHAMERLSNLVDLALWSGTLINRYPPDVAWQASDAVRRTLSGRPVRERLLAGVTTRGLRQLH